MKTNDKMKQRMQEWRAAACDLALSLITHYRSANKDNSLASKSVQDILRALSTIEQMALKDSDWKKHYNNQLETIVEQTK